MTARIAAKFGKEEQQLNGLDAIAEKIIAAGPDWTGYAMVKLRRVRVTTEDDQGGVQIPTVGITHIEPLTGDAASEGARLLQEAHEVRTGRTPLFTDGGGLGDGFVSTQTGPPTAADSRDCPVAECQSTDTRITGENKHTYQLTCGTCGHKYELAKNPDEWDIADDLPTGPEWGDQEADAS